MTVLRLLSYNVRSLRDDSAAVTRVIRFARPHVVCVQEAPRLFRWRSRCAALARRAGLVVLTGGRPAAGNLLLCQLAVEVRHAADVRLSRRPGLHRRGAAVGVCRLGGAGFAVVGTHLDLDPAARLEHVGELLGRLPSVGVPAEVPLVVAGDINEPPGAPAWSALAARLTDAFAAVGQGNGLTFSTARPRQRIDGIFVGPGAHALSCEVLDSPDVRRASDHRPVLAEVELGD